MPQDIDLVLPCYNPPVDFALTVDSYFQILKAFYPNRQLNLYVVNDGSTCNFTDIQIQQLRSIQESVHIVTYCSNHGKGYALRKAVAQTTSQFIIYTDYDFPFRMESMLRLIEELDKDADIVLVSRDKDYLGVIPIERKIFSVMSKQMNRFLLRMKYFETQGGLKGFNQRGKELFLKTTTNEFLFDTEFIYIASMKKDIRIVNILGITREDIRPNKIPLRVIKRELINFFKILMIKRSE
jgi:glycosyltransferase involved in cell wall biosynthesis